MQRLVTRTSVGRSAKCSNSPEHSEEWWGEKRRIYLGGGSPRENVDEAEHALCKEGTLITVCGLNKTTGI